MKNLLNIVQVVICVLLGISILLQNRGTGLSGVLGGGGEVYRTKRGVERSLFILTIILAVLFLGISLFNAIIVS